ncbi:hypothetical protein O1Q96_39820 [Streptomyces sp. Qhu-G9]|uniref:hypothetical protein n=1 Tax=Streptomyces sp. Qhu-G9 TaxID=3452799 RepID=UPI0022AC5C6F|nr:hypothetical protein [Streptomyces aurantiacus]WAU85317.1 hypothetical protein O1Q96_39820 [Streptomyces aurantiacus]
MGEREGGDARPDRRAPHSGRAAPAGGPEAAAGPVAGGGSEQPWGQGVFPATAGSGAADPAEERALAAFRAARDAGAHGAARTRRRDDWRPHAERRHGWSVRTTLVALAASVTLGGVAVAGIGSGGASRDVGEERGGPVPVSSTPADAGTGAGPGRASPGPSGSARAGGSGGADDSSGRPSAAGDAEAHCRAYDSVRKRGKALDSTAWQRLVKAAGGEGNVEAYCAGRQAGANGEKGAGKVKPGKSAGTDKTPGKGATKSAKAVESAKPAKTPKAKKG